MKKKWKVDYRAMCLLLGMCVFAISGPFSAMAQDVEAEAAEETAQVIEPAQESMQSETVTINVKDANIAEVLKAYSLQTGQSIVVGPDVVSESVNVRLNDIPWQDALDVILKPYGFGYRQVGDTIVISKLENIVQVEGIEPLGSKVFTLKYLDAYDVKEVCEAQLTSRGKITILSNKGLPGWEVGGSSQGSGSNRSVSNLGSNERREVEPIEKSKTIIVTDVPSSLTAIATILEELDKEPKQVLIESRFIEVSSGVLTDIGVDLATGINEPLTRPGVETAPQAGNNRWGVAQNDSATLTPAAFDPLAESLAGVIDYNSGLQLLFAQIGGENVDMMLHALEEDGDANVLSAPQILTLDNQEAVILVGTKFPIIQSDSTGGGNTTGGNVSTSLDYYENVGIQLNVIPQISNEEYINMIVHPAVSSIDGFESGVVSTGAGERGALTRYPVLKVREAQTQILLKSGDSAVIGGLQEERDRESVHKVPLLGDIPYLGALFRRTTTKNEKIELLIFIKASIIEGESYAAESAQLNKEWEARRTGAELEEEPAEEEAASEEVATVEEPAEPGVAAAAESVEVAEVEPAEPVEGSEEAVTEEAATEEAATEEAVTEEAETEEVPAEEPATEEPATEEVSGEEDIVALITDESAPVAEEEAAAEQM